MMQSSGLLLQDALQPEAGLSLPAAPLRFVFSASNIAGWVAGKFAAGIVGAIGGAVFNEVLDAIGLGGPDLGAKLDDIASTLRSVEQSVNQIRRDVAEILARVTELHEELEQYTREPLLLGAFSNIDTALGAAASPVLRGVAVDSGAIVPPTLMELLTSPPSDADDIAAFTDAFVLAEGQSWQIPSAITVIHNVLVSQVAAGKPLLVRWMEPLQRKVAAGELSLEDAYRTLESYFTQAIAKQTIGVSIHCVALGAGRLKTTTNRSATYLKTNYAKLMHAQTALFLECVEKLVLMRAQLGPAPARTAAPCATEIPGQAEEIFLRADLLCAALNLVGNTTDANSPKEAIAGIYGRALVPTNQLASHNLELPGYPAQTGHRAGVVGQLHAVVLSGDQRQTELLDWTTSTVSIVRHFWRWPKAADGKPSLPPQGRALQPGFRGGVRPEFYNIFGDNDWPLAASFVAVDQLEAGAPAEAIAHLLMDGGDLNSGVKGVEGTFVLSPRQAPHPLRRSAENNTLTGTLLYSSDLSRLVSLTLLRGFELFVYGGARRKARLVVTARCGVKHYATHTSAGVALGTPNFKVHCKNMAGSMSVEMGQTIGGFDNGLSLEGRRGYAEERDLTFSALIDIFPGVYCLALSLDWNLRPDRASMQIRSPLSYTDQITFTLHDATLRWE